MSLRSEDKERRKRERIAHEAALKAQYAVRPGLTQCEEAISLLRMIWDGYGEDNILVRFGTDGHARFKRALGLVSDE